MIRVTDAENGVTNYRYDAVGNLMVKELPNDVITKYIYNQLNQLVKEIRPEGDAIRYGYDKAGNLSWIIDRKGQKTDYTYRRDYLPVRVDYYDGKGEAVDSAVYEYDREGKRLSR